MYNATQSAFKELHTIYIQLRAHGLQLVQLIDNPSPLPDARSRAAHLLESMALFETLVEKADAKIKAVRVKGEDRDEDRDEEMMNRLNMMDEAMEEIWELWEDLVRLRENLREIAGV